MTAGKNGHQRLENLPIALLLNGGPDRAILSQ
jgi:hypothetical protein